MNNQSQIFYVNSEDRVSGTSSNFNIKLHMNDTVKFDSVAVLQMSIPLSYYLIRSPYDTFTLIEGVNAVSITVPNGNYNINTFKTTVIQLLNSNSPNGFVYNVTFDTTYAKYTFTVSNNFGTQPSIDINQHLGDQFGFDFGSSNDFVNNSLTSTRVVNFVSTNALFVHSNLVDDNTSVLQEVYSNNTIPYSFITWSNPNINQYSKKLKTNTDSLFNFSLCDHSGIEIDLNGQDIHLTLLVYKQDDFSEVFKKYLRLKLLKLTGQ